MKTRSPIAEWIAICAESGYDEKTLRKMELIDLYMLVGKVIRDCPEKGINGS